MGLVGALSLYGAVSQASGANVLSGNSPVFIDNGYLLDIRIPMRGGFAVTVADGVTAHFALSAYTANSRHISITSRNESHFKWKGALPYLQPYQYITKYLSLQRFFTEF